MLKCLRCKDWKYSNCIRPNGNDLKINRRQKKNPKILTNQSFLNQISNKNQKIRVDRKTKTECNHQLLSMLWRRRNQTSSEAIPWPYNATGNTHTRTMCALFYAMHDFSSKRTSDFWKSLSATPRRRRWGLKCKRRSRCILDRTRHTQQAGVPEGWCRGWWGSCVRGRGGIDARRSHYPRNMCVGYRTSLFHLRHR